MKIELASPARKIAFSAACLLLVTVNLALATKQFLAAYFSSNLNLVSLQRAVRLEPGNADYQYRLGYYFLQTQHEPEAAAHFLKSATALNPYNSHYWLALSRTYKLLANRSQQSNALQHAIAVDPSTPSVASEAANTYWSEGETEDALREFRAVLRTDPNSSPETLDRCWRIKPDVDALLRDVVPRNPDAYSSFLDLLISRNQPAAAATVWAQMARLQQPVETRHVFGYVQYLIIQRDVAQARQVWRDAAILSDLSEYQPSPENLVVNGDFSLTALNGGFDWRFWKSTDVSLALDPTESHSGHHSLSIVFDSAGMEDVGIQQFIPVEPNSRYRFSAHFKSDDIKGAGGPRFLLQDQFTGANYFVSEELKNADYWKQVGGTFSTGADTKLLVLRIERVPAGNAIRGKLWIDGVRLTQEQNMEGGQ
jgi:tetratricopeptide (TPR) repeat protein